MDAFNRLTLATEKVQKVWEREYPSAWINILKARGFVDEISHFFECVQPRSQPQTSAWESYKTQLLLEGMVEGGEEINMIERLLDANASDFRSITSPELIESIRLSEGRVVLAKVIDIATPGGQKI